jgi:hypothetical protein
LLVAQAFDLIQDLVRKTDRRHCDYADLSAAAKKVMAVCEYVEEMSDQAIKLEKKMELAGKIVFPKEEHIVLALPHRKFLWEDTVAVSSTFHPYGNVLAKRVSVFVEPLKRLVRLCSFG